MSLNNIKTKLREERGFTIVELLIVIVVIGILAAITIVSFNNVTSKANTSNAASNAEAVQKVAESFNADNNRYPGTLADFTATANTVKLPSGVTVLISPTALASSNGKNSIVYKYKGASATTATGGSVNYWDFGTNAVSTTVIYVGDGKAGDTFVQIAS
ncbi:MAG: prepilin-type N-terminal cleavage/methylation domain-containing protein [Candidatus Microsaccharimonas sossegonensis]|uniref:Prepilin-type N-terminal cleavage/methylation domain-containing protein n=1 Tax=Candidatus Microsaccharimonas sossegonensis TaxID=2506948 RepID=A0A4Q0AGD6_9BACT|nr:MAG: prepilin-type N-terminal cleavage/methylation domain-containing protein [Candidatus Microsaccharimonas sossegonensis]